MVSAPSSSMEPPISVRTQPGHSEFTETFGRIRKETRHGIKSIAELPGHFGPIPLLAPVTKAVFMRANYHKRNHLGERGELQGRLYQAPKKNDRGLAQAPPQKFLDL